MLLLITFLLSFTGYLLPWDQLAYWAITVGTNYRDVPAPLVGDKIRFLFLGGQRDRTEHPAAILCACTASSC